jgi:hypothetical protein
MSEVKTEPKEVEIDFQYFELTLDTTIGHTMGWIYRLAPNYAPRKATEIVETICKRFRSYYRYQKEPVERIMLLDTDELSKVLEYLFNFKDFRELNLSQKEFDEGVNVDSSDRLMIMVYNLNSSEPENDFIDLSILKRNIIKSIILESEK